MAQHVEHLPEPTNTGIPTRKLAFWAFLASESVFFASLLVTYLAYHNRSTSGPGAELFNLPVTSVSTFVLLMSSLTMVLAVAATGSGNRRKARLWLAATAGLGLVFLGFQAFEFTAFVREGLTLQTNLFGSSFFTLTGFHGAHVAVGVIWLLALLVHSFFGGVSSQRALDVEIAGLYWHFVDVVWIVLFTVVYLVQVAS